MPHLSAACRASMSRFVFTALLLIVFFFSVTPGHAASAPLPAYLTFPPQLHVHPDFVSQEYGEAEFPQKEGDPIVQRGRHWIAAATLTGVGDGTPNTAVWQQIRPSLIQSGWTVFFEADLNPYEATLRYQKNGKDTWLSIGIFGFDDIRMDVVEIGKPTLTFTLKPPAAKPEVVSATSGNFPYLMPLPGSKPGASERENGPMFVPAKEGEDLQAIGSGSIRKDYTAPAGQLSTLLFVTLYHDAFIQAGWTIVHQSQGLHQGDAVLIAHYAANGRDIWANLHNAGDDYNIQVADAGTEDFAKELDRDCHVALYGIHFDFNKSSLRPDSDPVLEKVLALLNARPDLNLEIQGHTDNVGDDAYNLKLSDARAKTVVDWLHAKGIAADRLTSHGYGLRVPIADNGSDEGRAKNRRVELKKQGCGK